LFGEDEKDEKDDKKKKKDKKETDSSVQCFGKLGVVFTSTAATKGSFP